MLYAGPFCGPESRVASAARQSGGIEVTQEAAASQVGSMTCRNRRADDPGRASSRLAGSVRPLKRHRIDPGAHADRLWGQFITSTSQEIRLLRGTPDTQRSAAPKPAMTQKFVTL